MACICYVIYGFFTGLLIVFNATITLLATMPIGLDNYQVTSFVMRIRAFTMKAKSGKTVTVVAPTQPEEAFEADDAKPGKVAEVKAKQIEKKEGKYGSTVAPAHKPLEDKADKKEEAITSWIEIELLDEKNNPVSGERYKIDLPDGSVSKGTLDGNGFARVDGIVPGECKVSFPKLENDEWKIK
jgi:hypothetical protein